jgi:small subunit ribosomal protein S9
MQEDKIIKQKTAKPEEPIKFKGKFVNATGRRKTATAQVRLYKNGKGIIIINKQKFNQYFSTAILKTIVSQPLKLTGNLKDLDFSILVKGGGKKAQAEAVRHGIARSLIEFDKKFKPPLKAKGWLTRDSRKKERKKPGLKKARRAPQWSKR